MKQNRTRTALADAYMHLLNDYTIDRITVKMITDAVGCSRKTFYYYFTDVYVLTQYVFELRVQQFLDTNGNFETMREGFLTLAANLSNDRQAILNIYHGYGKEELERFTWETSDYYARQVITRYAQNMDIAPEDLEAIIRMYTDMMFGMLIDWINNGMEGDYSRKLDIALTALMPVLFFDCRITARKTASARSQLRRVCRSSAVRGWSRTCRRSRRCPRPRPWPHAPMLTRAPDPDSPRARRPGR